MLRSVLTTIACLVFATGFIQVQGKKGFGDGEQEWNYVTVRPNARIFWWLYRTNNKDNATERPLLIWLQGGPGASSTGYGNFEELGPLDLDLNPRNFTWVNEYNVLFIDNPVGTGYSRADQYSAFAKSNEQIASDLLECVRGFFNEFPKWSNVPTYVTAESYGGKMAVEFALLWHKAQKMGTIGSNLRGVALGDSWISPIDSVLSWGSYLLQTGMVDNDGFLEIEEAANETKRAVDEERWAYATELWSYTESVIDKVTGGIDFYNILTKIQSSRVKSANFLSKLPSVSLRDERDARLAKLMNGPVKQALGGENFFKNVSWGSQGSKVFNILQADFMKPVTDKVERLLNETDIEVFVFTGQLDLIVSTPGTMVWVENLKWRNSTKWHAAERLPLVVNNVIEGYIKQYGKFKMYWINRSGHMVPRDNPVATAAMLKHLTSTAKNPE